MSRHAQSRRRQFYYGSADATTSAGDAVVDRIAARAKNPHFDLFLVKYREARS